MRTRARKLIAATVLTTAGAVLQPAPAAAAPPPSPKVLAAPAVADGRTVRLPGTFDLAGVSYEGPAGAALELRASDDGRTWTPWAHVEDAADEGPDPRSVERGGTRRVTQPVWTGEARYVQVRVEQASGPVRAVRVHVVDASGHGESLFDKARRFATGLLGGGRSATALTTEPSIVSRAEWGADERLRRGSPSYGTVRFAVVHHTVHANDYTRAEAPALIRSIYAYHVRTNGWDDIGYNFLVDRFGTVYEGRAGGVDQPVVGAHTAGFNSSSTGAALLGTFSSVRPPAAALDAVNRLLAWRLDVAHVDPVGRTTVTSGGSSRFPEGASVTVDGIVGHRDLAQTSCPGDLGYAELAGIRAAVDGMGRPKIYAPTAAPATIEGRQRTSYEVTTIDATASDPLAWTATIEGRNGVVRTSTAAGTSLSFEWDGTDASGANVAAGTYTVTLAGAGAEGPARPATLEVEVVDLDLVKQVVRLAGADRYSTAAAASQAIAPDGATHVVVASGDTLHLVDSLVAAPLAAAKDAPLLLTTRTAIPSATSAELDRLRAGEAWIVGGTAAVGTDVEAALTRRGLRVHRLAGTDAPATAGAVAGEVPAGTGAVVVARERAHLVDGLAAAGPAAALQRPVLLVSHDAVPTATTDALSRRVPLDVWAVGGQAAISDEVVRELRARRIAGTDRWATAVAVAEAGRAAGVSADTVVLASGESANLVDALAGGSFAEAIVLTSRTSLPDETRGYLVDNRSVIERVWVLGGEAAVGDTPLEVAREAIN